MFKIKEIYLLSDLKANQKRQLFWTLQIVGWPVYSIFLSFLLGPPVDSFKMLLLTALTYFIGFAITLILWRINKKLRIKKLAFPTLSFLILLSVFFLAILWIALDWALSYPFWSEELQERLRAFPPLTYIIRNVFWYSLMLLPWSLLYFFINFWIEYNEQKKIAERNKELFNQAKLIVLRYQLNPHFFFNSLNSIDALIDEDKELAKEMIYKLSDFLRYSFLSDNSPMVKLEEELEIIRKYFDIEKVRFDEDLQVIYNIDPETLKLKIPGFILNPIVENAVKYGMKTSQLPLVIGIISKLTEKGLYLKITNTGKWNGKEYNLQNVNSNSGIGLKNVYHRLENSFNSKFVFKITTDDENVQVIIEINSPNLFQNER